MSGTDLRIELAFPEQVLLDEIADPRMTRDDVLLTYALAMQSSEAVDWRKVNEAIVARWSMSALRYVKEGAWREVRAGGGAAA